MKFRWALLLSIGALPHIAQADWWPVVLGDDYVVTVGASVNGQYGEITYRENSTYGNYLPSIAADVASIPAALKVEFDSQVQEMAARESLQFRNSNLYGELNVTLQPNGAGYLTSRLTGLNYVGVASGSKSVGFLTVTCTATVRMLNIVANAQIGSATGAIPEDSVGLVADLSWNVNCSNNVSWIPFVGQIVNIWAEHIANGKIKAKTNEMVTQMKDKLFFERDANAYAGLNRIVPADKVIPLPNGQSFAVGQWLHGQLAWILNNVNANIVLGRGVGPIVPAPGMDFPSNMITGNVARFNLVVGGVTLNINMREEVVVQWDWYCPPWEACGEAP